MVTEAGVYGDKILVGLDIFDERSEAKGREPTARWQILTVRDGLVTDIRGFEDRAAATSRLG